MKKIKLIIIGISLVALTAVSCSKSFLDQSPDISLSVDRSITSESSMLEAVAGMYRSMMTYYTFGRNYQVLGDLLSDNVYMSSSNSGRLITFSGFLWTAESAEIKMLWQNTYFSILQANRILAADIPRTENVNYLRGECYTARALCYFYLVNWFGPAYSAQPDGLAVPIVTQSADVTGPLIYPERNTVKEVYHQIIQDLDSATAIMGTSTTMHANSSNFLSKYAAEALKVRASLYSEDYSGAKQAALDIITNGGYQLTADLSSFTSYWLATAGRTDKLESIFEINYPAAANNGVEGLDYMYSAKGFGDLLATDSLYNLYSPSDFRRTLMADSTRGGYQGYVVKKYQNPTSTDHDEIKLLRYAELLLNLSEAYIETGDKTHALQYLNELAKKRDPAFSGYGSSLSDQEVLSAIYKERRKELAFEGLRFFDLKRENVDFNREDMKEKAYSNYKVVTKTDFRRVLPIPQDELNANHNITPTDGY